MSCDGESLLALQCTRCGGAVIFHRTRPSVELTDLLCPFCGEAERRMILNSVIFRLVTALMPSGRGRLVTALERLVGDLRDYSERRR